MFGVQDIDGWMKFAEFSKLIQSDEKFTERMRELGATLKEIEKEKAAVSVIKNENDAALRTIQAETTRNRKLIDEARKKIQEAEDAVKSANALTEAAEKTKKEAEALRAESLKFKAETDKQASDKLKQAEKIMTDAQATKSVADALKAEYEAKLSDLERLTKRRS